ncbi:MAG: PIN domain-containing protein [Pseudolysinimonas sp.]
MAASAVLLDTDVFSALYVSPRATAQSQGHPIDDWARALTGSRVVVSFQTRAEALSGALIAHWGEARLGALRERLDSTPTVDVDQGVVEAFAALSRDARAAGHALGEKIHVGDRWIAACAISKGLPLLSGDGIYRGAPGLTLLELG